MRNFPSVVNVFSAELRTPRQIPHKYTIPVAGSGHSQTFVIFHSKEKNLKNQGGFLRVVCFFCTQRQNKLKYLSPFFTHRITHVASIISHPSGYRAQVYVKGVRESRIFRTKREASAWAARRETEILDRVNTDPGLLHTLADAIDRYTDEVSPTKKGERWEIVRAEAMIKSGHPLFSKKIQEIGPEDIAAWRDFRLSKVSAGSVLRDFSFLSAIFESARREWRWIEKNPMRDVRKPREPEHRDVVITRAQIRAMCKAMGYQRGAVKSVSHAAAVCFLVALRTGARTGELTGLKWSSVFDRYAAIDGKTGKRDLPLTRKSKRLFSKMEGFDSTLVFGVSPQTLDALFRRSRTRAGLSGFTFHDSRHTAATWLAPKIDVLTLCKIFGWKNPKMAMTYYNPKASDIADRLGG